MRALDLFCGAGGATRGYQQAGFHVVGVDVTPQPRYIGDGFVQRDAIDWLRWAAGETPRPTWFEQLMGREQRSLLHPEWFDLVHASPPCQDHSVLALAASRARGGAHGTGWMLGVCQELLPRVAARWGCVYVIENVPGAKMPNHLTLCGTAMGLGADVPGRGWARIKRHRWFQTNFGVLVNQCECHGGGKGVPYLCVYGHGGSNKADARKRGYKSRAMTGPGTAEASRKAMGIDWMTRDELDQAIPPAYTKLLGEYAAAHLEAVGAAA
ncbi:MAG: hypothetical protein LBK42_04110 [Propionibacteriaceae bacterium]|jgi:DNA (cytosine-5)-methyltransferase 1|nr:hypothetical protein [Propionibacteriaceae bacterium]